MTGLNTWSGGHLVDLSPRECLELLENVKIGRVAWCVLRVRPSFPSTSSCTRGPRSAARRTRCWPERRPGDRSRSRSTALTSPPSQGSVLLKGRGESKQPDELPPDLPYLQTWPEGPRPFVLSIGMREVTDKRLLAS